MEELTMKINNANNKKLLNIEEYEKLSEKDKANFKEMIFDEHMGPGDDIEVCYRAFKAGLKFAVFPFWVQHHRLTEHGSVDNPEIIKQKSDYFRKKHNI